MHSKSLYLITGKKPFSDQLKMIKKILPLGIDFIQYRNKWSDAETQYNEAFQLKLLCDLYDTPLIINDSIALAKSLSAHGVHLGDSDGKFSFEVPILGRTVKTPHAAAKAQLEGASYIGVGAFYPSKTKKDAIPLTIKELKAIKNVTKLPIFAIGGLTPELIKKDLFQLVDGFAFSDVLWQSTDPIDIIKKFKSISF